MLQHGTERSPVETILCRVAFGEQGATQVKSLDFDRRALSIAVATALLAGCGGTQLPIAAPGAMQQSRATTPHDRSWMLPEAKSEDLLYISASAKSVYVYSYPDGKREGTLTGFDYPSGLCVDQHGHIFVTAFGTSQIFEYAHGGASSIRTLSDPGQRPEGCSVDPTTGSLAVTSFASTSSSAGSVQIYKKARGEPETYSNADFVQVWFCGYDDAGNLFIDGFNRGTRKTRRVQFAELRRDGHSLKNVALNTRLRYPGGVQWDGKYVAIGDTHTIYQFSISEGRGIEVGSTPLARSTAVYQFWIQGTTVIGPNSKVYGSGSVKFWNYPAGGKPTKAIDRLPSPIGSTVSVAQ
jgi:hypothetical protein